MAALRAGAALSLIDVQHSSAFAPPSSHSQRTVHCDRHRGRGAASVPTALCLSSSDIQAKLRAQMAKLQERDRSSREISPDVSVDEHPGCCSTVILLSPVVARQLIPPLPLARRFSQRE
jgi:hypothetical protein